MNLEETLRVSGQTYAGYQCVACGTPIDHSDKTNTNPDIFQRFRAGISDDKRQVTLRASDCVIIQSPNVETCRT